MTLGSHQKTVGASQAHLTPRWIIETLGPFDLDPCASAIATRCGFGSSPRCMVGRRLRNGSCSAQLRCSVLRRNDRVRDGAALTYGV